MLMGRALRVNSKEIKSMALEFTLTLKALIIKDTGMKANVENSKP
jgi:hypothetical protein